MDPGPHPHAVIEPPRLERLEHIARSMSDEGLACEARDLATRVEEGRFHVACVGQFKRGKSTVVNALLGAAVLPTGVVPVTSAITTVRHGAVPAARVTFGDGRTEEVRIAGLAAYVSESENPENRKHVRSVEVFFPSPLLARGLCLVDTPGLGSPFGGNAATTRAFVPHIDAAVVVLGSDPPVSGDELDLVADVATDVRHLVFVLNKADRLTDEERAQGARFAAEMLSRRLRRPVGPLLQVSAVERLGAGAPTRDWAALERALFALARDAGAELVRTAETRGVERLVRALIHALGERHEALTRPLADSELRLATLRSSVESAERALGDLGVLLGSEAARLANTFRDRQAAFLPAARTDARRQLEESLRSLACSRTKLRAEGLRTAQEVMRRVVERFREELEPAAEEAYRRAMERFVVLANEFLARLAASGEPGLGALPAALGPEVGLRVPTHLYYTELLYRTLTLTGWAVDAVRPRSWTIRAVLRIASRYLDDLIEANSSRVANDLAERVAKSRARLEAELRDTLRRVTSVAEGALARARARRAAGEAAVHQELQLTADLRRDVESLLYPTPKEEVANECNDPVCEGPGDPGLAR